MALSSSHALNEATYRITGALDFVHRPELKTRKRFGYYVRFEVFTAVTMKNGVFWDITPCGSCKNRRFGGTWRLLHQGDKNR
jgi:hypothetical protein